MKWVLGCCLNWKVLVAGGAVAAAVLVFAPGTAGAVLPLLLLAICPLSMVVMMFFMRGMVGGKRDGEMARGQSREQAHQRLAELALERRQLEAQLAAEPTEATAPGATQAQASR